MMRTVTRMLLGSVACVLLVSPGRAEDKRGETAKLLLAALDRPVVYEKRDEPKLGLRERLAVLEKNLPAGTRIIAKVSSYPDAASLKVRTEGLRLGAALQLLADQQGWKIGIREYGLLLLDDKEELPPGAVPFDEFWKGPLRAAAGGKTAKVLKEELANLTIKFEKLNREREALAAAEKIARLEVTRMKALLEETTTTAKQAQADREVLKARAVKLEQEVRTLARELARLKALFPPKPGGRDPVKPNPPKGNLEGQVLKVDAKGELLEISLGSDDGLKDGHALEVFRLKPPKYLGTVRVLEVNPKKAVAKPLGRMVGEVRPGDRVAKKLIPPK